MIVGCRWTNVRTLVESRLAHPKSHDIRAGKGPSAGDNTLDKAGHICSGFTREDVDQFGSAHRLRHRVALDSKIYRHGIRQPASACVRVLLLVELQVNIVLLAVPRLIIVSPLIVSIQAKNLVSAENARSFR